MKTGTLVKINRDKANAAGYMYRMGMGIVMKERGYTVEVYFFKSCEHIWCNANELTTLSKI